MIEQNLERMISGVHKKKANVMLLFELEVLARSFEYWMKVLERFGFK